LAQAPQDHAASYGYKQLFVAQASGTARFRAIKLDSFRKCDAQRLYELLTRSLLTIDSGHFLDPADPSLVDHERYPDAVVAWTEVKAFALAYIRP